MLYCAEHVDHLHVNIGDTQRLRNYWLHFKDAGNSRIEGLRCKIFIISN